MCPDSGGSLEPIPRVTVIVPSVTCKEKVIHRKKARGVVLLRRAVCGSGATEKFAERVH